MKHFLETALASIVISLSSCTGSHIEVERIRDNGYCAFPSIVEFNGRYYVSCREAADGGSHGTIYDFDPDVKEAPKASIYLARIPKSML